MFSLMLHKLLHKKWMVLSLLIGNILLVSVAASYPLYRVSSFRRMLTDEFERYAEEKECWPAVFRVGYSVTKGNTKISFSAVEEECFKGADALGVKVMDTVINYSLDVRNATPSVVRDGKKEKRITLAAVSDLGEHVEILYGHHPQDALDENGYMEVMVSDEAMVEQDILPDDEYIFSGMEISGNRPLKLKVVGVFRILDKAEIYWEAVEEDVAKQVYTTAPLFRNAFLGEGVESGYALNGNWNFVWDYEALDITDVSKLMDTMEQLEKSEILAEKISDSGYMDILSNYSEKLKRIETTLLILQVPVLLLLCAFLYMIAGQMLRMEQNEISLLHSRGASRWQTIALYLMQSLFLSTLSVLAGIPLGAMFCKLLGSATAFLEFSSSRSLPVRFTADVIPYALSAVLLSVVVTTLPVISYSGLSIVNLKQSRSKRKKSLWKKMYLDVIFLALSIYGFYSSGRIADQVAEDVLSGNSLDPLLYISFSLFVLGAGLFCARLQPLLLKCFFALFKNRVRPSTYASLTGTIRTGAKQEFIIIFLILTVAIGISNTTVARTIVLNAVNNTRHLVGADIVLQEKWGDNAMAVAMGTAVELVYYEPDFDKYAVIPGVTSLTPVTYIKDGQVSGKGNILADIMGIRAKGFYEVTDMEDGLLPFSYAEYLNVLSAEPQAVIVSENFMLKQGYKLGDSIGYERTDGSKAMGTIYGFFDYWPGYEPKQYTMNEDGGAEAVDRYLIVANHTYLREKWDVYPYAIWMRTNDGGKGFYGWLEEQADLKLTKLEDMAREETKIIQDTMVQGTNGILSMSFIVILLLCCVGYLIYWIMSICSRELLFGVLRAMGMKKREIVWLLVVEQVCCGLYALACGWGIGVLASKMFVPMIQQVYAASEQVLPLRLISRTEDMVQLFAVIAVMLCICLVVLGRIVSKMNISSALKLGED